MTSTKAATETPGLDGQLGKARRGSARVSMGTAVPSASMVIRSFSTNTCDIPAVLGTAARLASQRQLRREAHQLACDPDADEHVVAVATRSVNAADAACAVLIAEIDEWAAASVSESRAAVLHTESLGQLIDRLATVWTQWRQLDESGFAEQARAAFHRLGELCRAYDDTVTDLHTGRRRLPRLQTPA